jgi:two-component system OmpR family response regulator
MTRPPAILLVEDDTELRELLARRLRTEGYEVAECGDGLAAVEQVRDAPPELVLLDVGLPGQNGFDACRAMRSFWQGPIVFVTARDEELDEVLGLELGGDDYLVKPVSARVLVARVRAALRRREPARGDVLRTGKLDVDPARREVRVGRDVVPLTTAEFDLVAFLAARAGQVVDRDTIYRELLGIEYDGLDRTVDVQVSRVRQKLGRAAPGGDETIRTVRGTGYLAIPGEP